MCVVLSPSLADFLLGRYKKVERGDPYGIIIVSEVEQKRRGLFFFRLE